MSFVLNSAMEMFAKATAILVPMAVIVMVVIVSWRIDFINVVERTKIRQDTILVSMDVTSLYTNIPQEEGITTACRAYDAFHNNNPPIPTKHLSEMLDLILKENLF